MNYREEVEIDRIDLLHYLLLKWRQALCFMLIGMILFGVYGYYKKVPVVIDDKGEVIEAVPVDEKSLAALGTKLSANEKREAVLAVEAYLDYEKSYADRQRAGESQLTMKYDAFHVPNYVYNYKISDYSFENVPDGSTVTNVDNIIALYRSTIVYDETVMDDIKKANNWECEDGFVRQLYSLSKSGLDMMQLSVTAPTKEECEKVIKVLDKKLSAASAGISSKYTHNLERIQELYYEYYDSGVLDQQKGQIDTLMGIEKTMQQVSNVMTADQRAYYAALLNAVKEETREDGSYENPLTIADREAGKEEEVLEAMEAASAEAAAASDASKAEESKQNVIMVPGKTISVKDILLGALVGIFAMCCFYGILYLISPKLRTKGDMQDLFRVTVLGDIKSEDRYNRIFSGVDRFIDSLFEKKDASLPAAERMDIITSAICLGLKKQGLKNLYITGACSDRRSESFRKSLVDSIMNNSQNDRSFSFATGSSPLTSPDSLKNLSVADCVVLVEEIGESRYDDIAKTIETCNKFGTKVVGTVVLC